MKIKALLIIPTNALLTGCSVTNQSAAVEKVNLGCEAFNLNYESNGFQMPEEAMKHFAAAARLDSGYIPLAKAADTLDFDQFANFDFNFRQLRFEALVTVRGVCWGSNLQ
jgi:hypothetical protein